MIVEVITFDDTIYQIATLLPDCRQCYNIGLPFTTTLKEALFVTCNGNFFPPVIETCRSVCCLVFCKCRRSVCFLSQNDCFPLGTDLYRP